MANDYRAATIDDQWYVVDDTDHPQPVAVCRDKDTALEIVGLYRSLHVDLEACACEAERLRALVERREDLARRLMDSCATLLGVLRPLLPVKSPYPHHSKAVREAEATLAVGHKLTEPSE